jgi:positive regulator of sigma E activity
MKPSAPETGTIIRLEGDSAVVMLKGGESCKGCGQAKIGLCKAGGMTMMLTAKNFIGAKVGDIVTIGIDEGVRKRGYLLSFIIPLLALVAGAAAGHVIGGRLSIPALEVITGFITLFLASFYSFKRLRTLDKTSAMTIKAVVTDGAFNDRVKSDEELRYEI